MCNILIFIKVSVKTVTDMWWLNFNTCDRNMTTTVCIIILVNEVRAHYTTHPSANTFDIHHDIGPQH